MTCKLGDVSQASMNMLRNRHRVFPVALLLLTLLASCERNTRVSIHENRNPPTFSLSGNGHLNFFWVSEVDAPQPIPEHAQTINGRDRILWQIWPTDIQSTAIPDLPRITYANVPAGFTQRIPAQGAPAPLVEGKIYEAGGPSSGANMDVLRFTIKDGSVVEIPVTSR